MLAEVPAVFALPIVFDFIATFFFAVTGAMVAIRRNYDIVGIIAVALISAVGGSVIRDGIFLQEGPPAAVQDVRYLYAILAGVLVGFLVRDNYERFGRLVALIDAWGLGAYAVYGTQKAIVVGLDPLVAVLIGVVNACGGGLLRDIIMREEPLVFKPGQLYVLAGVGGAVGFILFVYELGVPPMGAGFLGIFVTFLIRYVSITLKWQTRSYYAPKEPTPRVVESDKDLA